MQPAIVFLVTFRSRKDSCGCCCTKVFEKDCQAEKSSHAQSCWRRINQTIERHQHEEAISQLTSRSKIVVVPSDIPYMGGIHARKKCSGEKICCGGGRLRCQNIVACAQGSQSR